EIAPAKDRGKLTGTFQIMIVTGILTAYLTNFIFLGLETDAWRYMLGVMALPAFLFVILVRRIPESPRWLLQMGDRSKASESYALIGDQEMICVPMTESEDVRPPRQVNLFQK